jgi:hypothetical protein
MHAYSPNGNPIVSSKETIPGICGVSDEFARDGDVLTFEADGSGTAVDWDAQKTVEVHGQQMFVDDADREWPGCALVLVERELEEDETLPEDLVAEAKARLSVWKATRPIALTIDAPEGGWPTVDKLTIAQRALLYPVAATIAAMCSKDGQLPDPYAVERSMPAAIAIALRMGGIERLADVSALYPDDVPMPATVDGEKVIDLANRRGVALVKIEGIVWDDDGAAPDLPTDLIASVDATWEDDNGIVDMLSDHYGFCITGIGSTAQITRDGTVIG